MQLHETQDGGQRLGGVQFGEKMQGVQSAVGFIIVQVAVVKQERRAGDRIFQHGDQVRDDLADDRERDSGGINFAVRGKWPLRDGGSALMKTADVISTCERLPA